MNIKTKAIVGIIVILMAAVLIMSGMMYEVISERSRDRRSSPDKSKHTTSAIILKSQVNTTAANNTSTPANGQGESTDSRAAIQQDMDRMVSSVDAKNHRLGASPEKIHITLSGVKSTNGMFCELYWEIENFTDINFTRLGIEAVIKDRQENILEKTYFSARVKPNEKGYDSRFHKVNCTDIKSIYYTRIAETTNIDGYPIFMRTDPAKQTMLARVERISLQSSSKISAIVVKSEGGNISHDSLNRNVGVAADSESDTSAVHHSPTGNPATNLSVQSMSRQRSLRDEILTTRWILVPLDRLCNRQSGSFISYSVDYGRFFTIRGKQNLPPKKPRVDIEEKNFNEVVISVTMYGTDEIELLLRESPVEAAYIEYYFTRSANGTISERVKTRMLDMRRIFDRVTTYVDQPEQSSTLEKCEQQ
jgi:hypothetical protein